MPRKRITNEPQSPNLLGFLTGNWLNVLLIFAPISWLIEWFPGLLPQPKLWLFITSALAIIPLAGLISQATEELAVRLGPRLGGFLNATFGNAAELIIAVFALRAGLVEVVKASITGSILGNILLVLGISMFVGGVGREKQTFNRTHAGANAAALFLAMVALIMPAIYELIVYKSLSVNNSTVELLSMLVAGVLLLIYIASVIFAFSKGAGPAAEPFESHPCQLTPLQAIGVLSVATALAAWESELLVSGISVATKALGMTEFFVGVIVVAIIGNAAEHFTAVT
ncbi:MAG TPA: calcium/proton exchanger, partial [Armatimonadota bacterium]